MAFLVEGRPDKGLGWTFTSFCNNDLSSLVCPIRQNHGCGAH